MDHNLQIRSGAMVRGIILRLLNSRGLSKVMSFIKLRSIVWRMEDFTFEHLPLSGVNTG